MPRVSWVGGTRTVGDTPQPRVIRGGGAALAVDVGQSMDACWPELRVNGCLTLPMGQNGGCRLWLP